jgi:IS5 family transposase
MKQPQTIGFADLMTQRRKIKSQFFEQLNTEIDWCPISNLIDKHYQKGTLFRAPFLNYEKYLS